MSLQTPLARARGLGSAKSGLRHWLLQRLTAIALVPLSLWFVSFITEIAGADYGAAVNSLKSPVTATLLIAFIASSFYHAQLGLQVVIEDYVHVESLKVAAIIAAQFAMGLLGLMAIVAVLIVARGAA
jgi:succinate dehydrogenase / fumarate reductase membrane anchor subunit